MEEWKEFLQKKIKAIIDDAPAPYPKSKEGIMLSINETHLILKREGKKPEAIRISDIRRIELLGEIEKKVDEKGGIN